MSGIEFTTEGDETVIDAHKKVIENNQELMQRLASVGQPVALSVLTDIALDTFADLILNEEAKAAYEFQRDARINRVLRGAVENLVSGLIVPGGNGA